MKWKDKLVNDLLASEDTKIARLKLAIYFDSVNLHLAIFSEPFLSLTKSGIKTIDSRFSINNIAPFNKVQIGDYVLIKEAGGKIVGYSKVAKTIFFENINSLQFSELNELYGNQLCWQYDSSFKEAKKKANFLSLIFIEKFIGIDAISVSKKDMTGWSLIRKGLKNTLFGSITTFPKFSIGIIGKICSGKSSASEKIRKNNNFQVVSFGKFLYDFCKNYHLPVNRDFLQEIGQILVEESPEEFLHFVISSQVDSSSVKGVIFDGVRHQTIFSLIKKKSLKCSFIFVDTPTSIRFARYISREKKIDRSISIESFQQLDFAPTEIEIDLLKSQCNVILDSTDEASFHRVLEKISDLLP